MSNEFEELSAVEIRGGGDESPGFDAAFSFDRIESDEVEGNVLEYGQIMSRGFGPGTHLIVIEGHVHGPVQTVLEGCRIYVATIHVHAIAWQAATRRYRFLWYGQ